MLRDAIRSALDQTFEDFEIVVVDDGSTDHTREVALSFGDSLRYLPIPHSGLAGARNATLAAARGEYICLLDCDDLYYPHKLELQVDFLDRYEDVAMVYTEFSAFDDKGYFDEFHLKTYHRSAYKLPECAYEHIFEASRSLTGNAAVARAAAMNGAPAWIGRREYVGQLYLRYLQDMVVFTNSMMIRRAVLRDVGLQDPYFGLFHDLEFALRVCKAGRVGFIDVPTYKLRYHEGQVSATSTPHGERTRIRLQRDLLRVARRHARIDPALYAANQMPIDRLIGHRCRAAAIPLIAYGGKDRHGRRRLPIWARRYLALGARHGVPNRDLLLLSYLPISLRRICFGLAERWARIVGR